MWLSPTTGASAAEPAVVSGRLVLLEGRRVGLQARLAAYDQKLRTEGKLPLLPHQQHVFLHFVIVPLADMDKDGFVVSAPSTAALLGHDRDMLAKELLMQSADVMATVRDKLQARCAHAAAHLPA
ncbi:hypothetical protein HaLaN_04536 [Haematococcus lacustris]|uniref:Uncharacterized protein n=1 Tax=Haematococcus lacustris TaxID=44745 RepID=A0A699YGW8_HAELA|nr:hypothetical protein HaLaN_04536 [Haematococcus lacustris]